MGMFSVFLVCLIYIVSFIIIASITPRLADNVSLRRRSAWYQRLICMTLILICAIVSVLHAKQIDIYTWLVMSSLVVSLVCHILLSFVQERKEFYISISMLFLVADILLIIAFNFVIHKYSGTLLFANPMDWIITVVFFICFMLLALKDKIEKKLMHVCLVRSIIASVFMAVVIKLALIIIKYHVDAHELELIIILFAIAVLWFICSMLKDTMFFKKKTREDYYVGYFTTYFTAWLLICSTLMFIA